MAKQYVDIQVTQRTRAQNAGTVPLKESEVNNAFFLPNV